MVSAFKVCQHCGEKLSGASNWNRKYCNDKCRVAGNRAKKPSKKKTMQQKAEQFDTLLLSIKDSINRLEKHAKKAEQLSHDMSKTINERLGLIAMFREKTAIANELKLLLDMNGETTEPSFEARIGALYDVDPINYD
jgi:hypothetical protein